MRIDFIRWVFACLGFCACPDASAQIDQPGTQPITSMDGIQVPLQSSATCETCHGGYDGSHGDEPYDSWRGSLMGHAGRDPVAAAALAIAENDMPGASDFCLRCHSPNAWTNGQALLPYQERLLPDESDRLSQDRDGITCMGCHRMQSPSDGVHANARLHLRDGKEGALRVGPYAYKEEVAPHPTIQDPFLSSGEFCGSCHDIHNPILEGKSNTGQGLGRPFAIERTYSEWKASEFGDGDGVEDQTCQGCHMPERVSQAASEGPVRNQMSSHRIVGGSPWVLRSLQSVLPEQTQYHSAWETAAQASEMQMGQAATIRIRNVSVNDGKLMFDVEVINLTGHKLPTGYPEGRRMWVEASLVDEQGAVKQTLSGAMNREGALEPDAQLRTYEVILGAINNGVAEKSFHFILNDTVLTDTRIPPKGFTPTEDKDMFPVGRDYMGADGLYQNKDQVSYVFDACGVEGVSKLQARLLFQTSTKEYIDFLRANADQSLAPGEMAPGERVYELWKRHGGDTPTVMAQTDTPIFLERCKAPDAGMFHAGVAGGACGCRLSVVDKPNRFLTSICTVVLLFYAVKRKK